ncbi:MAG: hypothetical protein N2595_08365 [bacterium]|nr:hypothetical protein [bacterium]
MNKPILLVTAITLVMGTSLVALADEECCPKQSSQTPALKGAPHAPRGQWQPDPAPFILHALQGVQPPLSETQIEQINNLASETRAKLKHAKTPEERRTIRAQMRSQVFDSILTDQQRASLRERAPSLPHRPPLPPPRLDAFVLRFLDHVQPPLTDEQRAQIKKLTEETHAKMQAAQSPEERRTLHMQLRKTIMQTVLTEEQRASLPRMRRRPGMGPGMGKHKGPQPPAEGAAPPPTPPDAQ